MGLTIDYFYSLTPRQFFNIQRGWLERRNAESMERMLLTRKIMLTNLMPWSKGLTEEKIWPIASPEKSEPKPLPENYIADLEASKKRWQERDNKTYTVSKKLKLGDLQKLRS